MHWLRRLIFRGAWLDQRVKEGELDIAFSEDSSAFVYVQPDRGGEPIELAPEPSWNRVAYVAALTPPRASRGRPTPAPATGQRVATSWSLGAGLSSSSRGTVTSL